MSQPQDLQTFLSSSAAAASQPALGHALLALASACREIAGLSAHGALADVLGSRGTENVQGEVQKKLDVLSDQAIIAALRGCEGVVGIASEENEEPIWLHAHSGRPGLLVLFDPLDGSSNIDVNVSVGTIFGVLEAPTGGPSVGALLQPGRGLLAAGYAIYGPSTMLVLSLGQGVSGFTLCPETGDFLLTHPDIQIPRQTSEFAINASNERFWEPPVQRYIAECKAGKTGPRQRDFNMRWIASMVADVHRLMMRGGVFMYPRDTKDPSKPGRLRLLYEANPMSFLVEQAGGAASTGHQPILDVQPEAIHQRIAVILGSAEEVERVVSYHQG